MSLYITCEQAWIFNLLLNNAILSLPTSANFFQARWLVKSNQVKLEVLRQAWPSLNNLLLLGREVFVDPFSQTCLTIIDPFRTQNGDPFSRTWTRRMVQVGHKRVCGYPMHHTLVWRLIHNFSGLSFLTSKLSWAWQNMIGFCIFVYNSCVAVEVAHACFICHIHVNLPWIQISLIPTFLTLAGFELQNLSYEHAIYAKRC